MKRVLSIGPILAAMLWAAVTHASVNTPNHLALGIGTSLPNGMVDANYMDKAGPSRAANGEVFTLNFRAPKTISMIRLSAFSTSRVGRVLVRDARAALIEPNKSVETRLIELFTFNKNVSNGCADHGGLCLLSDSGFSLTNPNDRYNQITFRVEGFAHNDASLVIEIDSAEGISYQEFIMKRSGPSAVEGLLGGFIDEKNYSRLTAREYRTLMRFGAQPEITDLATKTFVCTAFVKNRPPKVDFKTRHYFSPGPGVLQSNSDKDPTVVTWILTQEGWKQPFNLRTGCGDILHNNVVRMTSKGNLISEINLDREEYLRKCVAMGYDYYGALQGLERGTYPSLIAPKYNAGAYEFCRPAKL